MSADRTDSPGTTSLEDMTDICGASDLMIAFRTGVTLACTLPSGHSMWTVNPATGYSYNHHDAERNEWWNDGRGPRPKCSVPDCQLAEGTHTHSTQEWVTHGERRVVLCPTRTPEVHHLGEFPMTCYRCHLEADS